MADDKTPTGSFGAPPAGAPHETTQPLDQAAIRAQMDRASANERELPPFNPPQTSLVTGIVTGQSEEPVDLNAASKLLEAAEAQRVVREANPMPAASETDSPSRGMPKPISDPGKTITGGFGHVGEAQYYALNGLELQEAVRHLMDEMNTRITNDLRFHMAICYPRLTVRLRVEVEGWAEDAGFTVDKVFAMERQTPIEVARERANEVVFVLSEHLREFDEQGLAENPPDRIRDTLGLKKPGKQIVQAGAMRSIVDIVPDPLPDDSF